MIDVHYCPRCELRFASRHEVEDHLATDHPVDVDDDTTALQSPASRGERTPHAGA